MFESFFKAICNKHKLLHFYTKRLHNFFFCWRRFITQTNLLNVKINRVSWGTGTVLDFMGWYAWIFFGYKWYNKLKKVIKPSRAKTTWTDSKYRNLPQGVTRLGSRFILMNFAKKGRGLGDGKWTMCRKMCHFSIFWYVCGYVKIIHYQDDYL